MAIPAESNLNTKPIIPDLVKEEAIIKKDERIIPASDEACEPPLLISFSKYLKKLKDFDSLGIEKSCWRKLVRYLLIIGTEITNLEQLTAINSPVSCKKICSDRENHDYQYLFFLPLSPDEEVYEFDKLGYSARAFFFVSKNILYILDICHHPDPH